MNDVKLNGMRELNFNEVEEVSGGNFWRLFFRSTEVGRGSDVIPSIRRDWRLSPFNYNSYNNFRYT